MSIKSQGAEALGKKADELVDSLIKKFGMSKEEAKATAKRRLDPELKSLSTDPSVKVGKGFTAKDVPDLKGTLVGKPKEYTKNYNTETGEPEFNKPLDESLGLIPRLTGQEVAEVNPKQIKQQSYGLVPKLTKDNLTKYDDAIETTAEEIAPETKFKRPSGGVTESRAMKEAREPKFKPEVEPEGSWGKPAAIVGGLAAAGTAGYLATKDDDKDTKLDKSQLMLKGPDQPTEEPSKTTTKTKKIKTKNFGSVPVTNEYDKAITDLDKRLGATLSDLSKVKDPPVTSAELRKQMAKDLQDAYDKDVNMNQWASLAQDLIGAVTQYAAAKEGLAKGLDLSGVEVDKTDWDKRIDQALAQYKMKKSNLLEGFADEDAKLAAAQKQKEAARKEAQSLADKIRDIRLMKEREAARARERALDRAARRQEKQEDREARREVAKLRAETKRDKGLPTGYFARYTDDPATARELEAAAELGEKALKSTLTRAGVQDKLNPGAIASMREDRIFGEDRTDVGKMRDEYIESTKPVQEPASSFPMFVYKDGQRAQVANIQELEEARSEGWE